MTANDLTITTTTIPPSPTPDAPAAEKAPHDAASGSKPRPRPNDTSFVELVTNLAREHGLTAEAIVAMSSLGLADHADESNQHLIVAYMNRHGKRMQRTRCAFPARRGTGQLTAQMLRATMKRHLALRGLTLDSLGWPATLHGGKVCKVKNALVTAESSLSEIRLALAALTPVAPVAEVDSSVSDAEVTLI